MDPPCVSYAERVPLHAYRLPPLRRRPFICVLCGNTDGRRCGRSRGWSILRCANCGLRRTWPAPDPELLQGLHDDSYYAERWMGTESAVAWAGRADEVVALLGAPQAAVLDFGAGDGGLVAALRATGLEAEGVEASEAGRRLARERGLVLHGEIPGDTGERFTGVTMLHVLEHLADPVATLVDLRRTLRPGGRLFVEVPNAASIDALWPPVRPLILDLPFHLHHFTPRTLAAVVARAGFEPLIVRRFNPLALEWAMNRRRPRLEPAASCDDNDRSGPARVEAARPPAAALWHRALPHVRRVLPGMKLQMVASA